MQLAQLLLNYPYICLIQCWKSKIIYAFSVRFCDVLFGPLDDDVVYGSPSPRYDFKELFFMCLKNIYSTYQYYMFVVLCLNIKYTCYI